MVIGPVVSEILGWGGGTTPPDAIALSKRADAINRYLQRNRDRL